MIISRDVDIVRRDESMWIFKAGVNLKESVISAIVHLPVSLSNLPKN